MPSPYPRTVTIVASEEIAPEQLLLDALGSDFLQYVLSASREDIERRLHEPSARLDPRQESAIAELIRLLTALGAHRPDQSPPWYLSLDVLGNFVPGLETSWPNATRSATGGSIAIPPTQSHIHTPLAELSRDMYPLFLLPAHDAPFHFIPHLARPLFSHPKRHEFEAAVMGDPVLSQLFPHDSPSTGPSGNTMRSTGSGGSIQLWMLAEQMIRQGWQMASLDGTTPSLDQLALATVAALDLAAAAVRGDPAEVPVLIGLTGVLLPKEQEIETPSGILRPTRQSDLRYVPESIRGGLTTTNPDGETIKIDYAGDVVLQTTLPYKLRLQDADLSEAEWPATLRDYEQIRVWQENTQLGLLLAVEAEPRAKVVVSWVLVFDPLGHGPQLSFNDTRSTPSLVPHQLHQQGATTWSHWIKRVVDHRTRSIDVAIRRILLAVTERRDASDALVDAVIAWENLVGSREGEPTLRVSAALSWLLDPNPETRPEMRRRIADLYRLRSDVVHGNRFLGPREAAEQSAKAIELTLNALRTLFQDRPDLLAGCRDGAERSNRLILGG
jgi:hypothetical protein